jgi:protein gp37
MKRVSDKSKIEWTDATWNPVTGCTKVSPGCENCYAEDIARRFAGGKAFPNGFDVQLRPDKLELPLRLPGRRRIFVNSMSDLFHDQVPDEYISRVFEVMGRGAPAHIPGADQATRSDAVVGSGQLARATAQPVARDLG